MRGIRLSLRVFFLYSSPYAGGDGAGAWGVLELDHVEQGENCF